MCFSWFVWKSVIDLGKVRVVVVLNLQIVHFLLGALSIVEYITTSTGDRVWFTLDIAWGFLYHTFCSLRGLRESRLSEWALWWCFLVNLRSSCRCAGSLSHWHHCQLVCATCDIIASKSSLQKPLCRSNCLEQPLWALTSRMPVCLQCAIEFTWEALLYDILVGFCSCSGRLLVVFLV